jgi:hypothetical protein
MWELLQQRASVSRMPLVNFHKDFLLCGSPQPEVEMRRDAESTKFVRGFPFDR